MLLAQQLANSYCMTTFFFYQLEVTCPRKMSFFYSEPMCRTTDEIRKMASETTGENYCCCHEPLLNIPLHNIIPDELHLMLRVTDILLENLIEDAMQWDDKEGSSSARKQSPEKSSHVKNLVKLINNCGVSFSMWVKKECGWERKWHLGLDQPHGR